MPKTRATQGFNAILASHIILSIVALPMVLTTFFFALTGRFTMHRRIARYTFPIGLYVSITGVVVFVFLKAYAYFGLTLLPVALGLWYPTDRSRFARVER